MKDPINPRCEQGFSVIRILGQASNEREYRASFGIGKFRQDGDQAGGAGRALARIVLGEGARAPVPYRICRNHFSSPFSVVGQGN
ncbi:hypothetical protein [Pseudooceanicola sp.]|uniref:hypothetical protein n=1 Tax=Pseudooceanicola sp. TaxID=1914328 RepID=UPI0035C6825B